MIRMKKNSKSASGRYVTVEKLQKVLSDLGAEITTGKQRVRVGRMNNSIIIYTTGGTVNITFNEKGGTE